MKGFLKPLSTLFLNFTITTSTWASISETCFIENPVDIQLTSNTTIPANSSRGVVYLTTYTLTSNLPFIMPTAFNNIQTLIAESGEFVVTDNCNGLQLSPNNTCTISIGLNAQTAGDKSATVTIGYGKNSVPLNISTHSAEAALSPSWTGLVGVDYQPNHYPNNTPAATPFNDHDVFYVGSTGALTTNPISNTYAEIAQLQAAGFSTVRSYQTFAYAWIDIINSANLLGMNVVYEAVIPQNGSQTDINNAVNQLNSVIAAVGATTFGNTVTLVFAGHENYSNTNVNYLVNAVQSLQNTLSSWSLTTPVSDALVSGDIVTPGSVSDMTTLINSYSTSAPIAFDPYPFQWGVTPANQAVSNSTLINTIAWDYAQAQSYSFYVAPRSILMAESGWATAGTVFPGYFCAGQNTCAPGLSNAEAYLGALYTYVGITGNNSGILVFEAYDEPAKDPSGNSAEDYYGVFDSNCTFVNNKSVTLLPNTSFNIANYPGCQGFINNGGSSAGAIYTIAGFNQTSQPPFTVQILQTNPPVTSSSTGITVTVPTQNRTGNNNYGYPNIFVYPWPYFLVYNGAQITVTGGQTGSTCSVTLSLDNAGDVTPGPITCNLINGGTAMGCNTTGCTLGAVF